MSVHITNVTIINSTTWQKRQEIFLLFQENIFFQLYGNLSKNLTHCMVRTYLLEFVKVSVFFSAIHILLFSETETHDWSLDPKGKKYPDRALRTTPLTQGSAGAEYPTESGTVVLCGGQVKHLKTLTKSYIIVFQLTRKIAIFETRTD